MLLIVTHNKLIKIIIISLKKSLKKEHWIGFEKNERFEKIKVNFIQIQMGVIIAIIIITAIILIF